MQTQVDLSPIEQAIPPIAQMLGIEPATALLLLGLVVTVANILGRLIPDDAIGFWGGVRKVAKVVGLFVPNRITTALSVNDVAKAVVTRKVTDVVGAVETESKAILREQLPDLDPRKDN